MKDLCRLCVLALAASLAAAGCGGGGDETVTIYLVQRLGPDGPPGQIAPVLTPVEREAREGLGAARQAILELRVGPSPDERARGFRNTLSSGTRLLSVREVRGAATVDLAGVEPDQLATAALVYSLTGLRGVHAVRLRLDRKPCCAYTHAGTAIRELTRRSYTGWTGEPCRLRTSPTHVRCRA